MPLPYKLVYRSKYLDVYQDFLCKKATREDWPLSLMQPQRSAPVWQPNLPKEGILILLAFYTYTGLFGSQLFTPLFFKPMILYYITYLFIEIGIFPVLDFWSPPPPFIFVPLAPSQAAALGPLTFSSRSARPPSLYQSQRSVPQPLGQT